MDSANLDFEFAHFAIAATHAALHANFRQFAFGKGSDELNRRCEIFGRNQFERRTPDRLGNAIAGQRFPGRIEVTPAIFPIEAKHHFVEIAEDLAARFERPGEVFFETFARFQRNRDGQNPSVATQIRHFQEQLAHVRCRIEHIDRAITHCDSARRNQQGHQRGRPDIANALTHADPHQCRRQERGVGRTPAEKHADGDQGHHAMIDQPPPREQLAPRNGRVAEHRQSQRRCQHDPQHGGQQASRDHFTQHARSRQQHQIMRLIGQLRHKPVNQQIDGNTHRRGDHHRDQKQRKCRTRPAQIKPVRL